jgi:thioredoxin-dependent peroxiredoxin
MYSTGMAMRGHDDLMNEYGVCGEKSFMGRKYTGAHRVALLIGPDSKIKNIWPQLKPDEHAEEMLAAL